MIQNILNKLESMIFNNTKVVVLLLLIGLFETPVLVIFLILIYLLTRILL